MAKREQRSANIADSTTLPVQSTCSLISDYSLSQVPKWRNWQTRMVQVHVLARVWGFESLLRHHLKFIRFAQDSGCRIQTPASRVAGVRDSRDNFQPNDKRRES